MIQFIPNGSCMIIVVYSHIIRTQFAVLVVIHLCIQSVLELVGGGAGGGWSSLTIFFFFCVP
jgi:hypothetical protein